MIKMNGETLKMARFSSLFKITDWLKLAGPVDIICFSSPDSSSASQSQLPRTTSRQLLNVSKEEDFAASLGNLC